MKTTKKKQQLKLLTRPEEYSFSLCRLQMDFMHVGAMPDHRDQEACADHVDQSMPTQCSVGTIAA